jgi:hypothetical protein
LTTHVARKPLSRAREQQSDQDRPLKVAHTSAASLHPGFD